MLIAWHAQFDGLILSHHYDVHPKILFCPMSAARMLLGSHVSVSLDNIRKLYGMKPKTTPYNIFRNKFWHELTQQEQQLIADGACDEVETIWELAKIFLKEFPLEEIEYLDELIKMFTEPRLEADVELLADLWESEDVAKRDRAAALGVEPGDLSSSDRFVALLEAEGVEVEYKPGKNGPIPALAKNDDFLMELLEHENERVVALAEARIGAKSTLLQTRAEAFGTMANRGSLCVYLFYSGASTLRPSGGDRTNFLNLKRGSPIRKAIKAPQGYYLAPVDASQIEFRVCMYLAGQDDVIDQLRRGEDPYIGIASEFYQERIYKPEKGDPRQLEMEQKRGAGKQAKLMCQYGASGKQFRKTAKAGLYGPPIDMSQEDADRFVALYRSTHPAVCARNTGYWAQAERMIARLAGGPPVEWGPLTVKDHKIFLPNGTRLVYDTLEFYVPDDLENCRDFERQGYWRVRTKREWKKMWGSKLVQNICEAVSRVIVTQAMIRIKRMGIRTLNYPYDELLLLIPKDGNEEQTLEACKAEMTRDVSWLPGLPLDCEGRLGERYLK